MKPYFASTWAPAMVLALLVPAVAAADDGCRLVAAISVEGVKQGAFYKCVTTGDPLACSVAYAAHDAATSGIAKAGVTAGCRWTVTRVGETVTIAIESGKEAAFQMRRTYDALNTAEGIRWLMRQISGDLGLHLSVEPDGLVAASTVDIGPASSVGITTDPSARIRVTLINGKLQSTHWIVVDEKLGAVVVNQFIPPGGKLVVMLETGRGRHGQIAYRHARRPPTQNTRVSWIEDGDEIVLE